MTKKKIWIAILIIGIILSGRLAFAVFAEEPSISLNGDSIMHVEANMAFKDPGATALINGKKVDDSIKVSGEVNTDKMGTYELTYTYDFLNKKSTTKRKVIVEDTTAPVIELKGKNKQTLSTMKFYKEEGYTATDSYDGDLTDAVKVTQKEKNGKCTITYKVTDSSGNTEKAKRIIEIKDVTKPKIELVGDKKIVLKKGETFDQLGVKATDDLDGDITDTVRVDGYINMYEAGDYKITYTAKDKAGNEASVSRTVTVTKEAVTNPIYLTFDDGPSTSVTPRILTTLEKNKINATFFILNYGNSNEKLSILKRMVKDGNTIGIHSYSHEYADIYCKAEDYMAGVDTMYKKIVKEIGYAPFAVRFPGGSSNKVSIHYCKGVMTSLTKDIEDAGYEYHDWNVYDGDTDGRPATKKQVINNVIKSLKKGRNNIVLMHDLGSKKTTAEGLAAIIDYGKKHGYTFYAISPYTKPVHYKLHN